MPVRTSKWESVIDRCPHCDGRLRIYVRNKVWTTKRSGYKTKARKKKKRS